MTTRLSIVDAFTDVAFRGNPAPVCLLDAAAPEPWMGAVAAELNLPMTAFVVPRADGDHDLRWFTPTAEVSICGHATLAQPTSSAEPPSSTPRTARSRSQRQRTARSR